MQAKASPVPPRLRARRILMTWEARDMCGTAVTGKEPAPSRAYALLSGADPVAAFLFGPVKILVGGLDKAVLGYLGAGGRVP